MKWIELIVHTNTAGSDRVSSLLVDAGATGTMIEDRADIPDPAKPHGYWEIIDPKMIDAMPEDVLVHAWFTASPDFELQLDRLRSGLSALASADEPFGSLRLETRTVDDQAWENVWKETFHPFYASEHIVIKPTWESFEAGPEDKIIEIDPGMAFGSGTHETTSMCLGLLEEAVRGGEEVIDVGTGSGILAIGAALLGASRVLAVDIDPDAVRVAEENVKHNRLSHLVSVRQGNLLDRVDALCDICVANIISEVIVTFVAPLKNHIRPGGIFICSGIVSALGPRVSAALLDAGYEILKQVNKGEWTAFISRRKD